MSQNGFIVIHTWKIINDMHEMKFQVRRLAKNWLSFQVKTLYMAVVFCFFLWLTVRDFLFFPAPPFPELLSSSVVRCKGNNALFSLCGGDIKSNPLFT